jgi:hypothetical protein
LSISTALSIVLNASNDEKQIKEALEFNNLDKKEILVLNKKYLDYISSIKPEDSVFINLENNLFIEKNQKIDDYLKIQLNDFFNCKSNSFDSSSSIDKINYLISDPENHINSADKLVLINNFSFKAKILHNAKLIDSDFNEETDDSNFDKKIETIIMNKILGFGSFYNSKFEACQLQYKKGFLMTIILPYDDVSIDEIELNSDIFKEALSKINSHQEYLYLTLPKFKIQTEYEVNTY